MNTKCKVCGIICFSGSNAIIFERVVPLKQILLMLKLTSMSDYTFQTESIRSILKQHQQATDKNRKTTVKTKQNDIKHRKTERYIEKRFGHSKT